MSGEYFNYKDSLAVVLIDQIGNDIEQLIRKNDRGYSIDTLYEFGRALDHLRYARAYVRRIDFLVSGDDDEDSFQKNLERDVAKTTARNATWQLDEIMNPTGVEE